MFNHKRLIAVSVIMLIVMAMPSLGASFRRKIISDQQFLDMCKEGNTKGVIEAINAGANVNAKDNDGATALIGAAYYGRTEVAELLLKHGADVNTKDENGYTALMLAAMNGCTEIVNALIEAGADDLIDNKGRTALIDAAGSLYSNTETVNALIDAGSYIKQRDNDGKMAVDSLATIQNSKALTHSNVLRNSVNNPS